MILVEYATNGLLNFIEDTMTCCSSFATSHVVVLVFIYELVAPALDALEVSAQIGLMIATTLLNLAVLNSLFLPYSSWLSISEGPAS